MNLRLSSASLVVLLFVGCEPPAKVEKKNSSSGPPTAAAHDTARPLLAQKAQPKPTPTAKPVVVEAPPPPPPPPPKRLEFAAVALPTGRLLTREQLHITNRQLMTMFPTSGATYFVHADSKDRIAAVFGFDAGGKVEGSVISYNPENKRPLYIASFRNGVREGTFRGWNDAGAFSYWAEFRNGQHEGLVCLVKQGEPVFVQEYRFANLKTQYVIELVDNKEFKAREVKPSDGAIDKQVQDYSAEIKALESLYLENEKAHRRDFVAYYQKLRDYEEYDRRTRGVAPTSPAKREELAKRRAFQDRDAMLFEIWQRGFWQTPL